jgi:hypothetical protein
MNTAKSFVALLLGVAITSVAGGAAFAHASNNYRPSNHTVDASNHAIEAPFSDGASQPLARGFTTISPADRALQRLNDLKQQTSDAGFQPSAGPAGLVPVIGPRDRELMGLGAEKDRMTGG